MRPCVQMIEYLGWLRRAYTLACWERDCAYAECAVLIAENRRLRAALERAPSPAPPARGWFF